MANSSRTLEVMFLQYMFRGWQARNIAVLMLDRRDNSLEMRFASNWEGFDDLDLEILSALSKDLVLKSEELGATDFVSYMKTTLSNTLQLSDPTTLLSDDPE